MDTLARLTKLACLVSLTVYFLVITYQEVTKYAARHTTVSKRLEDPGGPLQFPAISICPGYKEEFTDLAWSQVMYYISPNETLLNLGRKSYPKTEVEAEEQWNRFTYDRMDIFRSPPEEATIVERSTLSGRCYTVLADEDQGKANGPNILKLFLTNKKAKRINVYVHDRGAKIGLNMNFWNGNMTVTSMSFETSRNLDVALQKSLFKSLSGSDMAIEEYHDALNTWAEEKFRASSNGCWHPMFRGILSNATLAPLPYCSTLDDFIISLQHLFGILFGQFASGEFSGIHQPKQIPHYSATKMDVISLLKDKEREGMVSLYFYYGANMLSVEEEVLLLDLNGLVANIGGWLGLLIGVSCYGGIVDWVDFVAKYLGKISQ